MLKSSSDRRCVRDRTMTTDLIMLNWDFFVLFFWKTSTYICNSKIRNKARLACFNVCVCNLLLPCFSEMWAVSFISLLLHLRLHLSDHLLHPPQLRDTNTITHWPSHSSSLVISVQLVFALRDRTSASFSCKIISLSISSGSGPFLHDTQQV